MKHRLVRKTVCLLVTSLSIPPALADWYYNQSEWYYKPQEYHNEKYGNFPPDDINKKLFGHLLTDNKTEEKKSKKDSAALLSTSNQPATNQPALSPAQNYTQPDYRQQNQQQAIANNYNLGRNHAPPGRQSYNRNTNFSGPWNNNRSNFSGPWNNGRLNNGPLNNHGSSFNMPWGNNRSGFNPMVNNSSGFNPMGNGGSWNW